MNEIQWITVDTMARGRKRRADTDVSDDREHEEERIQRPKRARTSQKNKSNDPRKDASETPSSKNAKKSHNPASGNRRQLDKSAGDRKKLVTGDSVERATPASKLSQKSSVKKINKVKQESSQELGESSVYFIQKIHQLQSENKQMIVEIDSIKKKGVIREQHIIDNDSEKDFEIVPLQDKIKQKKANISQNNQTESAKGKSKSNTVKKKNKKEQVPGTAKTTTVIKSRSKKVNPSKGKSNMVPGIHQVKGELMLDLAAEAGLEPAGISKQMGDVQVMSGSDSESDWEEVEDLPGSHKGSPVKTQLPSEPVQITLEAPDIFKKKRKKKGFDMEAWFKRQMNRYQKDLQEDVHKVHLLCLLSVGLRQNVVLTTDAVKGMAISLLPVEFTRWQPRTFDTYKLEKVTKWFRAMFKLAKGTNDECSPDHEEALCLQLGNKNATTTEHYAQMYVSLLRILGLVVRLVISLRPVPLKPSKAAQEKEWKSKMKRSKGRKDSTERTDRLPPSDNTEVLDTKSPHSSTASQGKNTSKKPSKDFTTDNSNAKKKAGQIKNCSQAGSTKTSKKSDSKQVEAKQPSIAKSRKTKVHDKKGNRGTSDEKASNRSRRSSGKVSYKEESDAEKVDEKKKKKRLPKQEEADYDVVDISSRDGSDSDFEVSEVIYRSPLSSSQRKRNRKVVSSGSEGSIEITHVSKASKGTDVWAEIYLQEEEKWICVDCSRGEVNCASEMETRVTKPLIYVLGYDNENSVKDVTRRYANSWQSVTRKLRVEADWWEESLAPFRSTDLVREAVEDDAMQAQMMKKPLPTSLAEYKNHPLYALKKHLLKFEAIYPDSAVPVGYFKGEPVYARECVHPLHTRQTWLKEARVVRIGETAYKVAKGRQKWRDKVEGKNEDPQIDLFGRWQTEDYIPPPAVDGKVPRNEYGNVELFQPSMLPGGTVHMRLNGLNRIAKKLDIDCVPAMIGFDTHCGWSHPVIDGFVVCEEFKDVLLAAYDEDQEIQKEKEAQKREQRVVKNWTLLVKGLIIKERLKKRFDLQPAQDMEHVEEGCSTSEPREKATDVQQSWPRNRKEEKKSSAKGKKKGKKKKDKEEGLFPFEIEEM